MSTSNNSKTIATYNDHTEEYVAGTTRSVSGTVKDWIDTTMSGVPKDAFIFELGSGFGRDAAYLQDKGYAVHCTDAPENFVKMLRSNGFNATVFNAITDNFPSDIDVVLANAVLLHFTRDETKKVLQKVFAALKPGGTFGFTLKQGTGEEWSTAKIDAPRFFCYWKEKVIHSLLEETGFSDIEVWSDQKTAHATWLQIIAKKP